MVKIVNNWLNGSRTFKEGVKLYEEHGTNAAFKRMLREKGPTTFNKDLLVAELSKLSTVEVKATPAESIQRRESLPMPEVPTDPILISIRNEWLPLYQRMNYLRATLDKYGSSNSDEAMDFRKETAFEILSLEKQCNAIWVKRDHYVAEGKLPFEKEIDLVIPEDPMALGRLIESVKRNIRRNRQKVEGNPGVPKYAQLLEQYKAQYKRLTNTDYNEPD